MRLRLLLATHANQLGEYILNEDPQQLQYQEIGQQTDESLILETQDRGLDNGSRFDDATATAEVMALAPSIEEYLIACFTNADLDNSGVLSCSEFSRLLCERVDLKLSPEDTQLLLDQAQWMDAKGDVTWPQFVYLAPQLLANLVDTSSTAPSASDWCACISTEGTPYYYNKRTQESSWDKPVVDGDQEQPQLVNGRRPTKFEVDPAGEIQEADSGQVYYDAKYVDIL